MPTKEQTLDHWKVIVDTARTHVKKSPSGLAEHLLTRVDIEMSTMEQAATALESSARATRKVLSGDEGWSPSPAGQGSVANTEAMMRLERATENLFHLSCALAIFLSEEGYEVEF